MSSIEEMIKDTLEFNKKFVEEKRYEEYAATKYPDKKLAILSCMDTRLTELLPAALNLKNGDVKLIKTAGAFISHPWGSVMRSLIVSVYMLKVENVFVIAHYDCGMEGLTADKLVEKMRERNIGKEKFDTVRNSGIDINRWITGFSKIEDSVTNTVNTIKNHPFIPESVGVYGFAIDPGTGRLDRVV